MPDQLSSLPDLEWARLRNSVENASNFSATFNPIFLWQLSPRLLYEGRLELKLSGSGASLELEYSLLTYLVNDYITLGTGENFNSKQRLRASASSLSGSISCRRGLLAVYDGLLGERSMGAEVRAFSQFGPTRASTLLCFQWPKFKRLRSTRTGTLDFNNFTDNNDNNPVGGCGVRLSPLPWSGDWLWLRGFEPGGSG